MNRTISSAGHDEVVPLPLGLADEVDQMIGAFRKLKMEGRSGGPGASGEERGKFFSLFRLRRWDLRGSLFSWELRQATNLPFAKKGKLTPF